MYVQVMEFLFIWFRGSADPSCLWQCDRVYATAADYNQDLEHTLCLILNTSSNTLPYSALKYFVADCIKVDRIVFTQIKHSWLYTLH